MSANVIKKLLCAVLTLGLFFGALNVVASTTDCPDCPPDKDGSIFPGGSCKNCNKNEGEIDKDGSIFPGGDCDRCNESGIDKKGVRIVEETEQKSCPDCPMPEFKTKNYPFTAPRYKSNALNRNCCDLASFTLKHVDFRLENQEGDTPYSNHVGNYRFRIFGCRRPSKKAMLNRGRVIQKNMAFYDVFEKSVDKCYKVLNVPADVCLKDENVKLPEYVLTAEITNFFMNICDEYDWKKAKKANRRNGTAEMTVTWRLLNLSQTEVLWKGVTAGYAEVENGVFEAEVRLAEEAFAEASRRLSSLPGFENQLRMRPSAEVVEQERANLIAFDEKFNPGKCGFEEEIQETYSCDYAPQPQCPAVYKPVVKPMTKTCPCANPQPCVCNQPVCQCPVTNCLCEEGEPKVEEFVDVKTETTTVERKIITTTRVETPQPVCRQVCRPVCPSKKVVKTVEHKEIIETVETVEEKTCPMQCEEECTTSKCRKVCTKTCEEGGVNCTEECVEDCGEDKAKVEETGGVEVSNAVVESQIEETGGVKETHRVYENCIDEKGDVISDGSCTIIDDNWVDLEGYDVSAKLCIADRPPYKELSPENMSEIRGSVVEIENAKGNKGMGLIVSRSFVLTSASLVNKLQNTYDVKTLNGEVLKAKAVRVNPGKNVALLYLETPTNYTPLSLNLELPAIDQEGFISLGIPAKGQSTQDYMDDNGKIYGYRYSDNLGTEIIVDTLVQKVSLGSVLVDKLGTINGISNSAKQTEEGMDLFIPTETAIRGVGLTICEKVYEKKSPWQKTVYKPVTEKVKNEAKAPEAMVEVERK
ncbi:MAG: hypothetical protein IKW39_03425 [Alphaproteobacteria bacterium]|nr:hypothetical protein [Alphaproteobacteria bacterium]